MALPVVSEARPAGLAPRRRVLPEEVLVPLRVPADSGQVAELVALHRVAGPRCPDRPRGALEEDPGQVAGQVGRLVGVADVADGRSPS